MLTTFKHIFRMLLNPCHTTSQVCTHFKGPLSNLLASQSPKFPREENTLQVPAATLAASALLGGPICAASRRTEVVLLDLLLLSLLILVTLVTQGDTVLSIYFACFICLICLICLILTLTHLEECAFSS